MSDDGRTVWELRVGIYATEQQAEELKEHIARTLCPDPDHAPPCPVPWAISLLPQDENDEDAPYADLVTQARIESS